MFGFEERINNAKTKLINALLARAGKIIEPYNGKPVTEIPKIDITRATVLEDIADVIRSLTE